MNQNLAWTSELRRRLCQPAAGGESGHSNHAAEGSAGRELEDYTPGERDYSGTNDRHSTGGARRGIRTPIRSLAGVRVSTGRFPRLVSLSGAVLGRSRNRFWTWVLALDCLPASAGVGTIGDTIGTVAAGSCTTTTRTSRIAESIVNRNSFRSARTSAIRPIFAAADSARVACVPAPSAGSIMAGLREPALSEGGSSFGGFHGGAFAGGFHGGGGGFHGGGGGRR